MNRGKRKHTVGVGRSVVLAALGSLLSVGTSCVVPPEGISMLTGTEQEDIPVPKTFDLRHSHSPDFDIKDPDARFRSWEGEYIGKTPAHEVVPWYIKEMRIHKWEYKGIDETKDTKLYFEKGDESAEIWVYRETDGRIGGFMTIVRAEIHPRGPEDFTVDQHLETTTVLPASFKTNEPDAPSPADATTSGSERAKRSSTSTPRTPKLDAAELEVIDAADTAEPSRRDK
jgi:hypothetical protein